MNTFRPSDARGRANFGWLDSRHTFSFGRYFDPGHIGFGALCVINEDNVLGGAGFDMHDHRDMEIVSYVLAGALEHKDSIGTGSVIRPGDVQCMSAGTGIRHSEYNHSKTDPVHFLQIWITPERGGLEPSYDQKAFHHEEGDTALRLLGSRDGRDGSLTIRQDVDLHRGILRAGQTASFDVREGRKLWIQVTRGTIHTAGQPLYAGDGFGVLDIGGICIEATDEAEFLLFDLAAQ